MEELRQRLAESAPVISIRSGLDLFEAGRNLFARWALSVTDLKSIVLISSKHVTSTLGALALGYCVASFPPLPIHGRGAVETFFREDFQRTFGNVYLPSWEEDLLVKIRQRLYEAI